MKVKIVSILLIVMILILQIPALANTIIPEIPDGIYDYWLIHKRPEGNIYLISSPNPITVTTDGERIVTLGHTSHELVNGEWVYKTTSGIDEGKKYREFEVIITSNHDIEYEDGSGFFFRPEESDPTIPDDEDNGFWEDLEDFFSWFDPDSWLHDISNSVQESVGLLTEPIERIINFLNPIHEDFFLRVAFIPSQGYVEEFRTDIKEMFDDKFSFISEIRDFLAFIFSSPIIDNPGPPEFKITLPGGKWGTGSVQIIDFSIFEDYRLFIINFIRVLLWIPFLIKLYKRLPSIVY